MGAVVLEFKPRESLKEFTTGRGKVSLIRRTGGKKSSPNMIIQGENLATLAGLKTGFSTAKDPMLVDLIIIDPPYNVGGNQGYKNTWNGVGEKEREWAGDHGAFLDFMEPRLKIGRQLLTEEGMIFINICDGEYARLKILMNQIFGEENEIATFIWDKGRASHARQVSITHEYILCYAKNKQKAPLLREKKPLADTMLDKANELVAQYPVQEAQKLFKKWVSEEKKKGNLRPGEAVYQEIHPKTKRLYRIADSCAQDDVNGTRCKKKLIHPITGKPCPIPKNGWKWKEETLDKLVADGMIYFGKDHTIIPKVIKYLDEKMYQVPLSVIYESSDGAKDLPDGITFTTPKPIKLMQKLISFYPKQDAKIMDFFAGSGATAHAVIESNKEDGGQRTFIMIEEMASTYNKVLVPRIKAVDKKADFATYETETVPVGGKDLLKKFNQYSFDFLSAYHFIEEENSMLVEGMNILGTDKKRGALVAFTVPDFRKSKYFFEEELSALKSIIKKSKCKSAIIYTLSKEGGEEPWRGVDKSILSGTTCKELNIIGIPDELVEEWNDVLNAMAS